MTCPGRVARLGLAATAAVFLGVMLRPPQYLGGALTVIAVLLLAPSD